MSVRYGIPLFADSPSEHHVVVSQAEHFILLEASTARVLRWCLVYARRDMQRQDGRPRQGCESGVRRLRNWEASLMKLQDAQGKEFVPLSPESFDDLNTVVREAWSQCQRADGGWRSGMAAAGQSLRGLFYRLNDIASVRQYIAQGQHKYARERTLELGGYIDDPTLDGDEQLVGPEPESGEWRNPFEVASARVAERIR